MKKWFPWIVAIVFAGWALGSLRVPKDKQWAINEFGKLPLMFGGRVQPIDSLARNSLLQIREKARANAEPWKNWWEKPKLISATEWAMLVMMKPEEADTWPVFRIDNPDVKSLLGLPAGAEVAKQNDGKHYSWKQIEPKLADLRREAGRAAEIKDASLQNPYERALLHMWNSRMIYTRLKNALGPARTGDLQAALAEYSPKLEASRAAVMAQMRGEEFDTNALQWLSEQLDTPIMAPTPMVAAAGPAKAKRTDSWRRIPEAVLRSQNEGEPMPEPVQAYAQIAKAYRANDAPAFNAAVAEYKTWLAKSFGPELGKATKEFRFNFAEPFYKALVLYVVAFLLALVYWAKPSADWLRLSAVACTLVALAVHSGGLITRMALEGRPPVTNLYSSAVFIGWGACVLGLLLEKLWRNSIGVVVSAAAGFITLIIAHHLAQSGDTMEMMQAVLDTNFWLATHVVVVTLGYASTFVAGLLGIIYVVMGVFTPNLTSSMSKRSAHTVGAAAGLLVKTDSTQVKTAKVVAAAAEKGELGKSLARMVFGILCFATLFSFVGTVLGGIWADQSWGRFWGWDPKENGALIIVLWNALILHARMGGIVRERGIMVLALVGNIVTSWSWFGVNMLGIGLHSYGFMSAAFMWLMLFIGSQLLLIALGSLPLRYWKSFRDRVPAGEPPTSVKLGPQVKPA
jgi:cytochrome c-type biogenesis protein CcsB